MIFSNNSRWLVQVSQVHLQNIKKKEEWQHFFQGNKKTLLLLFQCDTVKNNAPIVSQNWKTFELQRYVLTLHI